MDRKTFENLCDVVQASDIVNSLILIYTDTHDVRGPFLDQQQRSAAYERALSTGRPFTFQTWIS